jgi:hypothetical protein
MRTPSLRFAGWSAIACGVATVVALVLAFTLNPPLSPVGAALALTPQLVFYLAMIPIALWLWGATRASAPTLAGIAITGAIVGVAATVLVTALPNALFAVTEQIIATTALGAVGVWLILAGVLGRSRDALGRALAAMGMIIGLGWLLPALIMYLDLAVGAVGGLTVVLEGIRGYGGDLSQLLYTIWAIWLGIRLLRRSSNRGVARASLARLVASR